VPPLRERPEDIPVLAKFYLERYSRAFSRNFQELSAGALALMEAYEWPGNIRELKNVIERICIMHAGPVLEADYLPREIGHPHRSDETASIRDLPGMELGLEAAAEQFEMRLIRAALERTGGNVLQAAQILKIPRGTLRYKMAKYSL
jgi:two-component system response regulator AtoC